VVECGPVAAAMPAGIGNPEAGLFGYAWNKRLTKP